MNEDLTIRELRKEIDKIEKSIKNSLNYTEINNFSEKTGMAIKNVNFSFIDITTKSDMHTKSRPGIISIDYFEDWAGRK